MRIAAKQQEIRALRDKIDALESNPWYRIATIALQQIKAIGTILSVAGLAVYKWKGPSFFQNRLVQIGLPTLGVIGVIGFPPLVLMKLYQRTFAQKEQELSQLKAEDSD